MLATVESIISLFPTKAKSLTLLNNLPAILGVPLDRQAISLAPSSLMFIFVALAAALPENLMGLAMFAFIGAYVWALLAMYIGRLNDMGWSAWCVVGILVPVVNLIVFGAMLFTPTKK